MKIAIVGYGKMGKAIEETALQRGHQISFTVDQGEEDKLKKISPENTDVAIEFSQPDAAFKNIKTLIEQNIRVISGTTGWLDKKKDIENLCIEKAGTFFYASNFSIGVNIFFKLSEYLAGIMNNFSEYDVKIEEIHHVHKKDAPSGTAITLVGGILSQLKHKKDWVKETSEDTSKIVISSKREGEVPGTHSINYFSLNDNIEIKHTAHSRKGFVSGAVMVAEWIIDKKGVLGMKDFLQI